MSAVVERISPSDLAKEFKSKLYHGQAPPTIVKDIQNKINLLDLDIATLQVPITIRETPGEHEQDVHLVERRNQSAEDLQTQKEMLQQLLDVSGGGADESDSDYSDDFESESDGSDNDNDFPLELQQPIDGDDSDGGDDGGGGGGGGGGRGGGGGGGGGGTKSDSDSGDSDGYSTDGFEPNGGDSDGYSTVNLEPDNLDESTHTRPSILPPVRRVWEHKAFKYLRRAIYHARGNDQLTERAKRARIQVLENKLENKIKKTLGNDQLDEHIIEQQRLQAERAKRDRMQLLDNEIKNETKKTLGNDQLDEYAEAAEAAKNKKQSDLQLERYITQFYLNQKRKKRNQELNTLYHEQLQVKQEEDAETQRILDKQEAAKIQLGFDEQRIQEEAILEVVARNNSAAKKIIEQQRLQAKEVKAAEIYSDIDHNENSSSDDESTVWKLTEYEEPVIEAEEAKAEEAKAEEAEEAEEAAQRIKDKQRMTDEQLAGYKARLAEIVKKKADAEAEAQKKADAEAKKKADAEALATAEAKKKADAEALATKLAEAALENVRKDTPRRKSLRNAKKTAGETKTEETTLLAKIYKQSVKESQDRINTLLKNRKLRQQVERDELMQKNKQKQVKKVTQVRIKGGPWITVSSVTKDTNSNWWTAIAVDGSLLRVNGKTNIQIVDIEVPLGSSKIQLRF